MMMMLTRRRRRPFGHDDDDAAAAAGRGLSSCMDRNSGCHGSRGQGRPPAPGSPRRRTAASAGTL